VEFLEDSGIFGVACNVSCPRALNFELKLTLNLDVSVQQFRERLRLLSLPFLLSLFFTGSADDGYFCPDFLQSTIDRLCRRETSFDLLVHPLCIIIKLNRNLIDFGSLKSEQNKV
jgi:hypothetical protein